LRYQIYLDAPSLESTSHVYLPILCPKERVKYAG